MAVVFLQGFASTLLHFELEDHYYCAEHDRVTHDGDHARQTRPTLAATPAAALPHDGEQTPDDERPEDENCRWLVWLQSNAASTADLHPQLLNLPPPSGLDEPPPLTTQPTAGTPIPLRYVSPINSPPGAESPHFRV